MNALLRRHLLLFLLSCLTTATPVAAQSVAVSAAPDQPWKAGSIVTPAELERIDTDACFRIDTISDALFRRMWGKSYKPDCTTPRSSLRHLRLLHVDAEGRTRRGELICHADIAPDLQDIFRELFRGRYPIERVALVDDYDADDDASMRANNTTCFNFRRVAGSRTLSLHARGRAVDINPLYNPWVRRRADGTSDVQPPTGRRYADRTQRHAYVIRPGDLAHRLFLAHGFRWGGAWRSSKDYQHFEK